MGTIDDILHEITRSSDDLEQTANIAIYVLLIFWHDELTKYPDRGINAFIFGNLDEVKKVKDLLDHPIHILQKRMPVSHFIEDQTAQNALFTDDLKMEYDRHDSENEMFIMLHTFGTMTKAMEVTKSSNFWGGREPPMEGAVTLNYWSRDVSEASRQLGCCSNLHCCESSDLKTCTSCGRARYCSKECQKTDWNNHKRLCRILSKDRAELLNNLNNQSV